MPKNARLVLLSSLILLLAPLAVAQVGQIDPEFGYGGTVTLALEEFDVVLLDSAVQPDGKIVVSGFKTTPGSAFGAGATLIARFLPDGTPDFGFGVDGMAEARFDSMGRFFIEGTALALDAEGNIVVGGALKDRSGFFGLLRLTPQGTLDGTFRGGQFLHPVSRSLGIGDLTVLDDGSIVAVGSVGWNADTDFAIHRFGPDGQLDTSFGGDGGLVRIDYDQGFDAAASVTADSQGRIVVVGRAYSSLTDSLDFGVLRLLQDGSLDTAFGDGGQVLISRSTATDQPAVVAIQDDGKIVVAGTSTTLLAPTVLEYAFSALRLRDSGRIDTSFGRSRSGWVTTDIGTGSVARDYGESGEWTMFREFGLDLAIQFDGKIVLVGTTLPDGSGPDNDQEIAVLRYTAEGDLDPTFGVDGALVLSSSFNDEARTVSLQRDGRIVIAGPSSTGGSYVDYFWDRAWGFVAQIEALEPPLGDLLLLVEEVEQLLADARMTERTASSLLRSLEGAIDRLQNGDPSGAVEKMESFVSTVDREAQKGGIFELEVADQLTAWALDIIAQLAP